MTDRSFHSENMLAEVRHVYHAPKPIYYVTTFKLQQNRCVSEDSIEKVIRPQFVAGQYVSAKTTGQIYKVLDFVYDGRHAYHLHDGSSSEAALCLPNRLITRPFQLACFPRRLLSSRHNRATCVTLLAYRLLITRSAIGLKRFGARVTLIRFHAESKSITRITRTIYSIGTAIGLKRRARIRLSSALLYPANFNKRWKGPV